MKQIGPLYEIITTNVFHIGFWSQNILDYFLNIKQIKSRDGAEIIWYHRANSKQHMKEAIQSKYLKIILECEKNYFLLLCTSQCNLAVFYFSNSKKQSRVKSQH